MINRKELDYVSGRGSNIPPFPGIPYCENAIVKLKEGYNLYNLEHRNRKYTISFSNNEEIKFSILEKNICHILGIDYKDLMSDYKANFREEVLDLDRKTRISSYQLLSLILNNADRVIEHDFESTSPVLNYYKIMVRCEIFSKLADLSKFNYGCINFNKLQFDRDNPKVNFTPNSTKYLYTLSNEIVSPYYLMGLKKETPYTPATNGYGITSNDTYIIETLLIPDNPKQFFKNQRVSILTQILTDNNGTLIKNEATAAEKIKLLREYKEIIKNYCIGSQIDIFSDYLTLLTEEKKREESSIKLPPKIEEAKQFMENPLTRALRLFAYHIKH